MDAIDNVRTTRKEQHGVPENALRDSGVKDARKVGPLLTGFLTAVRERGADYQQREQDELREVAQIHERGSVGDDF